MTNERLAELEALCEQATPTGHWSLQKDAIPELLAALREERGWEAAAVQHCRDAINLQKQVTALEARVKALQAELQSVREDAKATRRAQAGMTFKEATS